MSTYAVQNLTTQLKQMLQFESFYFELFYFIFDLFYIIMSLYYFHDELL